MRSDDLQHFILGYSVTIIFGWQVGTAVNLTLEATQANFHATNGGSYSNWDWPDTIQDLVMTETGVLLGEISRKKIRGRNKEVTKAKDGLYLITCFGDTIQLTDMQQLMNKQCQQVSDEQNVHRVNEANRR